MRKVIFAKYNRTRRPSFQIVTSIFEENGVRMVEKKALTAEAAAHVSDLRVKSEKMAEVYENINVLLPEIKDGKAYYPYLTGSSLDGEISAFLEDPDQLIAKLNEINAMIFKGRDSAQCKFTESEKYNEYFGVKLPEGLDAICPSNVDMLYDNLMYQDGRLYCMDCEWVFDFALPLEYLIYRSLFYFYTKYQKQLRDTWKIEEFLEQFGFDKKKRETYNKMEKAFQEYVRGVDYEFDPRRYVFKKTYTLPELEKGVKNTERILKETEEKLEHSEDDKVQLSQTIAYLNDLAHAKDAQIEDRTKYASDLEQIIAKMRRNPMYRIGRIPAKCVNLAFPRGTVRRQKLYYAKQGLKHPGQIPYMLSAEGKNKMQGEIALGPDYTVMGRAELPYYEKPLVSIVIPAYNQVLYTYKCLHSIIKNSGDVPYEVILADDVSTDATTKIDQFTKNLVISRNSSNMGFLKNCNQAAAKAKGEYILFLNNDTQVQENWLQPLVDLMDQRPDAGMVGSKLVYPDGKLQEAGGIIWADGSGWNYGRMQDPDMPEYNYVKEADYISGAAIMIRKSLWLEIGGFDERYAPAYCEDSDLAFEVRKHGYKLYYQPKSVVVHFEGVSNGTDLNSGLKKYQVENTVKFREKWADVFEKEQAAGPEKLFVARDRSQGKKVVLFIDHYVPQFDKDAGSRTTFAYIKLFVNNGYTVKFLGDNFMKDEPYTGILQQMGVEVLYGPWYQANWKEYLAANGDMIDIAFMERPHITIKYIKFFREHSKGRILYYGHDLHYVREMREYELTGDEATKDHATDMRKQEYEVMRNADMAYYPSYLEAEEVKKNDPTINVRAIQPYIYENPQDVKVKPAAERKNIMFIGGFAHLPNRDCILWFVKEVFPKVLENIPDIVFTIMGSNPPEDIRALASDHIVVKGFVTDEELDEAYRNHRLSVVPLRYGAGVKGKVVEAMYNRIPLVTTPIGVEGLKNYEEIIAVKEDADEFADEIISMYTDYERLDEMVSKMPAFIEKYYSPESAMRIIAQDLNADKQST